MIETVPLKGKYVILEPLSESHFDEIISIALDANTWQWNTRKIEKAEDINAYLEDALRWASTPQSIAYVTTLKENGKVVGMTRFGNIVEDHKRLEIGWTWVGADWRRSFVNSDAKYLMLEYAFEDLKFNRVEIKTDTRNLKSRNAMLRLGAKEEGILRNHMIRPDHGDLRDSIYYSIIALEWPEVKQEMIRRMSSYESLGTR